MNRKIWIADGMLLLTALIWGGGFVFMKNSLDSFPPGAIIAMRYAIGSVLAALIFRKHLKGLGRGDLLRGGVVGLLLSAAYIVQTIGLDHTTAGRNAFLTTVYVLIVPIAGWLLFGQRLRKATLAAAALMLTGIGLLSLDGEGGGLNIGDLLTLAAGTLFAAHIIAVDHCHKKTNVYALIVLQFAAASVCALAYTLIFERGMTLSFTTSSVGGLLYLSVVSTMIAMSLQNIGQSMAPAAHASILLSLESVFGALFSFLLLGERMTPQCLLGFAVIFAALMVNQLLGHEPGENE